MSWNIPPESWSAPGADAGESARLPGVDERLVQPEMRSEYVEGLEMFAAPANPPHATDHARLAFVLGSVVRSSYRYAVDMLTRSSELSDFAPDASVFEGNADGSERKLEELAFEVADKQAIGVPTTKARLLSKRGVRRVFCILVKSRRVLEWDPQADTWKNLPHTSTIEDHCFVAPLEVGALLDAAMSEDNVARALLLRGAKPIEEALERRQAEAKAEGLAQGKADGLAQGKADGLTQGKADGLTQGRTDEARAAVRELCEALGVIWTPERAAEVERLELDALRALRAGLVQQRRWPTFAG